VRSFLAALRFLTILPVPGAGRPDDAADARAEPPVWGRATAWYPAVGLLLGAILAGLDWGLGKLFPPGLAAALLLAAWVVLTGGLHLDGFIDCCDGLLAPVPRERRLEILRDVHAGAFGIAGVVLLLLVKVTALAALPGEVRLPALLLVPTLARWCMTGAVVLYPYARSGPGLGEKAKTGAGRPQLAIATVTALLACGLAGLAGLGWITLALLLLTALTGFLVAQWIQARIGGLTGDTYGAICELAEAVALLALAALAYQGVLP
jgi:cobalamin 5'-phosphate synthase/cobalamin synthase